MSSLSNNSPKFITYLFTYRVKDRVSFTRYLRLLIIILCPLSIVSRTVYPPWVFKKQRGKKDDVLYSVRTPSPLKTVDRNWKVDVSSQTNWITSPEPPWCLYTHFGRQRVYCSRLVLDEEGHISKNVYRDGLPCRSTTWDRGPQWTLSTSFWRPCVTTRGDDKGSWKTRTDHKNGKLRGPV